MTFLLINLKNAINSAVILFVMLITKREKTLQADQALIKQALERFAG